MELLQFTEAHRAYRERLRTFFAKEVTPFVDTWEASHIVPRSVWRKMGQAGFLCPCLDPRHGGLGGDFRYSLIGIEELARTNHNGLAAPLHSDIVVPYIDSYGSEGLKARYLPRCASGELISAVAMTEPGAGSDLAGMQTTAVEEGDAVVLNGSKTFITNGINCDLVVLAAKDPAEENPHHAVSLYVVEAGTPGFSKGRQLEKMGFHSQDTAELFFANCRIPRENRLGEKGQGFLMLMQKLQQERLVVAVWAVPVAEFLLEWTTAYCRRATNGGRPLIRSQAVQFALAEMTTDIRLGRTFVEKLVAEHIAGGQVVTETSMAKYWATEMVNRTAGRCLELIGREALLESCPLARTWRDMRVMSIFAGTNEIMKGIIAKNLKL